MKKSSKFYRLIDQKGKNVLKNNEVFQHATKCIQAVLK